MAEASGSLDAAAREAVAKLADIEMPTPVSWVPQTWGWAALALLLLVLCAWLAMRAIRSYRANAYRRAALAELRLIEARLTEPGRCGEAVDALPPLLKRVALAAWPRSEVASLSGGAWVAFLRAHGGPASLPESAARLLDDLEYRGGSAAGSVAEAQAIASAVRNWIEGHVVSA